MKFVANGPDVPEKLIREHEEGNVVFFCGAGISIPSGMPSFCSLVEKLCEEFGEEFTSDPLDQILDRLEHTKAKNFRPSLHKFLKIKRNAAVDTHVALTKLATNSQDNTVRLVTTNFDHLFEKAYKTLDRKHKFYAAPLLPLPKKSKWDGIVYLHGLLPSRKNDKELSNLVITSGDFGLAYLKERWAARFVSELFRNFSVCFVGYSLNDPVMRYMTDAISADRMYGEKLPDLWAFVSDNKDSTRTIESWKTRGIQPILYSHLNNHQALHETLKIWADLHSDGANGKEMIVAKYAGLDPLQESSDDDFVGRVLWALADPSCKPAKRFSEMDPTPSLNWLLGPFTQQIKSKKDSDGYSLFSSMVVKQGVSPFVESDLNSFPMGPHPIYPIVQWTLKYINDKRLIFWLLQQGDRLSRFYKFQILGKLHDQDQSDSGIECLDEELKRLWRLFLADALRLRGESSYDFYTWLDFFSKCQCQATYEVRAELRKVLAPKIIVSQIVSTQKFSFELGLTSDDVKFAIENFDWFGSLSSFVEDFQLLLKDALAMAKNLVKHDTLLDLPSIESHPQNQYAPNYTVLIELLRDSWIDLLKKNPKQACVMARQWLESEETYFNRLGLFAASLDDVVNAQVWIAFLLENNAKNLWNIYLQREILRLFVKQGKNISSNLLTDLISEILKGPKEDVLGEGWVERKKWLYLSKLQSSGVSLNNQANLFLETVVIKYPEWALEESDRDEFPIWCGDIKEIDTKTRISPMPNTELEIRDWLTKACIHDDDPIWEARFFKQWGELCLRHPLKAARSIRTISPLVGQRELGIWRRFFQVVSDHGSLSRLWRMLSKAVVEFPIDYMEKLSNEITWWMYEASKRTNENQDDYLKISTKLISLKNKSNDEEDLDIFVRAINDPLGRVALTLLNILFSQSPQAGQGLQDPLKKLFTSICDQTREELRPARMILASNLISLFRIDQQWTQENLLPLFSWKNDVEASVAWQGFLYSPKLYLPLLVQIKSELLETAFHFDSLGQYKGNYASFITHIALDKVRGVSKSELREVLNVMPKEGLKRVARVVYQLASASDKKASYWKNRVKPFLIGLWPNDKDKISPELSALLARIAITSDGSFSDAINTIINLLQPVTSLDLYSICEEILKTRCAENYPKHTLDLLHKICPARREVSVAETKFRKCLGAMVKADNKIMNDARYKKLDDLVGV